MKTKVDTFRGLPIYVDDSIATDAINVTEYEVNIGTGVPREDIVKQIPGIFKEIREQRLRLEEHQAMMEVKLHNGEFRYFQDPAQIAKAYADTVETKDSAYRERNQLVALLTKLLPAHMAMHDPNDKTWEDEWRTIIYITLPDGRQASWHIHDSEKWMFSHLKWGKNEWDGHTTEEKYQRIMEQKPKEII